MSVGRINATVTDRRYSRKFSKNDLDSMICSCEPIIMAAGVEKQKYRPVVEETPQSKAPIHGRGASWSPANRFETLHVDLTDVDVVDAHPEEDDKPRRATQD